MIPLNEWTLLCNLLEETKDHKTLDKKLSLNKREHGTLFDFVDTLAWKNDTAGVKNHCDFLCRFATMRPLH